MNVFNSRDHVSQLIVIQMINFNCLVRIFFSEDVVRQTSGCGKTGPFLEVLLIGFCNKALGVLTIQFDDL